MSSRYYWMLLVLSLSLTAGCMTTHTIKPMHQMESGEVSVAAQVQGLTPAIGASGTVGVADVMDLTLSGSGFPAVYYVVGGGPRFYLGERLLLDLEIDLHYATGTPMYWHGDLGHFPSDHDWLVTKQSLAYTFPAQGWAGFVGVDLDQATSVPLKDDYEDTEMSEARFQGARVGLFAGLEAEVGGGLSVLAQAGLMVPIYERIDKGWHSPYTGFLAPHGEVGFYYTF